MNVNPNEGFPPSVGGQGPPPVPEGMQQFCLRWNSFPATVATNLATLQAQGAFVDVTLACEGRQVQAHKVLLSACSPYFMEMLKSTPCQHPVIFLRDVGFRQLVALLDFMYKGEVNVSQAELPALLRTAESLQVRGLADTNTNNNNNSSSNNNGNNTNTGGPVGNGTMPTCPNQQTKQNFPTQFDQMGQPVMPQQPPPQLPMEGSGCIPSLPVQQQQQQQQQLPHPVVTTSSGSVALPSTSSMPCVQNPMRLGGAMNSKRDRASVDMKHKQEEQESFEMTADADAAEQLKNSCYITDGNANMAENLEESGQIFPDDPSAMGFDLEDGNGENQSEEESSEMSEDEEGEPKEFTYQSDASYSQEGANENDPNLNGENSLGAAGPSGSGLHGMEPGLVPPKIEGGLPGHMGGGRNRLSRSLWPPGIPYHGPQQCPYCTRILSNVGNWRKHVLTMHFAREKVFKCTHCSSAFRTAEYLQKHYVRVHNYPQKMTRRKFVEQEVRQPAT